MQKHFFLFLLLLSSLLSATSYTIEVPETSVSVTLQANSRSHYAYGFERGVVAGDFSKIKKYKEYTFLPFSLSNQGSGIFVYIAVFKNSKEWQRFFIGDRVSIEQIKVDLHHISVTYKTREGERVEQDFLYKREKGSRLKLGLHRDWMPISGMSEDGKVEGLVKEYIALIERESGFKIDVENRSFAESVELMKERKIDMIIGDLNDLDLKHRYIPIYTHDIPVVVLMHGNHKHIESMIELRGKKIAIERDALYKNNFYSDFPTLNFIEVEKLEDGIRGVYDGKYDAILSTNLQIDYILLDLGLSNFNIVSTTHQFLKLSLFLHKEDRELIEIFTDIFIHITTEEKHAINKKYSATNFVESVDYTIAYIVAFFSLVIVLSLLYYSKKIKIESKKRREAEEDAKRANEMKSLFLANMSHEIRTPMNSVIGFSDLLETTELTQKQQKYLLSIKAGAKSLLTLINDILDISKIEAGKFEVESMAVDVEQILLDMESIFKTKCEAKGLAFVLKKEEGIPQMIESDEVRIRQILINLLSNAIKFTQSGSVRLEVAFDDKRSLIFKVIDSGIGVKKESQEYIFEAFSQQLGQSNKEYGGTGLGLSISSKLAKLLHGDLICESDGASGATFIFTMRDVKVLEDVSRELHKGNKEITFTMQKTLIVDDNSQNIELLSEMLRAVSLDVKSAKDGKEALTLAQSEQFEIVLTDIRMPVMDGKELLKALRAEPHYKSTPIIAVTASVMKEEQQGFLESGFDAIIEKPLEREKLLHTLEHYLECVREESEDKEEERVISLSSVPKEIYEMYESAQKSGMMEDMASFARYTKEYGKEHNNVSLEEFGRVLEKSIEEFDIITIEELKDKLINTKIQN